MKLLTTLLLCLSTTAYAQFDPNNYPPRNFNGWVLTHIVKYPMGEMRAIVKQYHTWAECYEAIPRATASGDMVGGINDDANKMAIRDQTRGYPAHFACFDNPLGEESDL